MIDKQPAIGDTTPPKEALKATVAAIAHFKRKLEQSEATSILLSVKTAGCSGLKYDITYVDAKPEKAFDFELEAGLHLYVPHEAYPFVQDCQIDYVKEGINNLLKINNPNETGACGCGESFSVS